MNELNALLLTSNMLDYNSRKSVPVWFVCKACRGSFQELNDFLEHKKEHHFEEFQNTKCIIFEERGIQTKNDDHILGFPPAGKGNEDANPDGLIDPPKIEIKDENNGDHSSYLETQCHTVQNMEVVKTEHQRVDQYFEDNIEDFIQSNNVTSGNSDFDFNLSLDTLSISQNSLLNVSCAKDELLNSDNNFDFGDTIIAGTNLFISASQSAELGSSENSMQTQHNPFVLLKRLTPREIQNCSVSENNSSSTQAHSSLSGAECTAKQHHGNDIQIPCASFTESADPEIICTAQIKSKPKQCAHCPKKFRWESNLRSHALTHNKPPIRFGILQFTCEQLHCGKTFQCQNDFASHLASHPKKFKCPQLKCVKTLSTKYHLQRHIMTVHKESRPFKCPQDNCDKFFKTNSDLQHHQYAHSDERKYKCSVQNCEKSFKQNVTLRLHLLTHSDARPLKCTHPKCEKTFKTKYCVRSHMNAHTRLVNCPQKPGEKTWTKPGTKIFPKAAPLNATTVL